MAQTISIKDLCTKLNEKLHARPTITGFYIGKTNNIETRENEHEEEGYSSTIALASGTYEQVSKAEESLIFYFSHSDLSNKLKNKSSYSVGSKDADIIYVSIMISPQNELELYDDDLLWDTKYVLAD